MKVELRPVESVVVKERIRASLGDLTELAASMKERGLINPITVEKDGTLVAGARRLAAAKRLGWAKVACHIWRPAEALELFQVEQEENTCREPLTLAEAEITWQARQELIRQAKSDQFENTEGESPPPSGSTKEAAAEGLGYSDWTMRQVEKVRKATADPEPAVREVAEAEYTKLKTATKGSAGAAHLVALARRRAEDAKRHAPAGAFLQSDRPRAAPPRRDWEARLYETITTGRQLEKVAEELELADDVDGLTAAHLKDMVGLLQGQINQRERLKLALRTILRRKSN